MLSGSSARNPGPATKESFPYRADVIDRYVGWGLLSGLIGGIQATLVLWGAWMLPSLGLVLTRVSITTGIAAVLIIGVVSGGTYALLAGDEKRASL